jgi:FtsP/CotA-like multicopper oxidase with cupredoxin domain
MALFVALATFWLFVVRSASSTASQSAPFDPSQCEKSYTFDVRDWVVDYLRPTLDLGGKASRQAPFDIPNGKKKAALLINNLYPGPVVEAMEGELVCVKVVNNLLSEPVAIHWHGVKMRGFPSMDGVYGVTQAGIAAQGGTFTYRFRANAGTHWYHAHMQALQADRGLKGAIVIHPRKDPHKHLYDEERIVSLSDEWQNAEVCLKAEGAQPGNPVCAEIEKASWNGQWGDGSEEYPWPVIDVEQGKCYRLRFIGMMGQAQNFLISMAGHNMTLIAADGVDVEPTMLSQFNLHAGERMDVVVCADQAPGNYLMTATYDLACFLETAPAPHMPKVDSCNYWAFLRYAGHKEKPGRASRKLLGGYNAPEGSGAGKKPKAVTGPAWDTNTQSAWSMVKNLNPVAEPEKADITYVLDVGVQGPNFNSSSPYATTDRMYMFTKVQTWKKPETPLLHTKGECGAEGVPFITVPDNATTVELIINNLSPTAHVLHLHGMTFSVVNYAPFSEQWCSRAHFECFFLPLKVAKIVDCPNARAGDPGTAFPYDAYWGCPYDEKRDGHSKNLETPLQKDMISLWRRSWAVIRFKADNPGTWTFHCHMEQHIPTGQIMAFNIKPSQQPAVPDDVPTEGTCPVWSKAAPPRRPTPDFLV